MPLKPDDRVTVQGLIGTIVEIDLGFPLEPGKYIVKFDVRCINNTGIPGQGDYMGTLCYEHEIELIEPRRP